MPGAGDRRVVYCLLPYDLAARLHEPLRRHFRADPRVEVVVERRRGDRRRGTDRRAQRSGASTGDERRRVRAATGRRVGERRAALIPLDETPPLPRRAARHAERIAFVERYEPSTEHAEDLDTGRLVTRFQAGERDLFATLYSRYFDRVYAYLRVVFRDPHEAEDLTQHVFLQVFEALTGYERRRQPFRAWLFTIVRNQALSRLSKLHRSEPVDPQEIARRRDHDATVPAPPQAFDWLTDRDLLMLVERLPLAQQQALALRFMLDLSSEEIGRIMGRNADDVRTLQHRGLRFLERRLTAIGRGPVQRRSGMLRDIKPHNVLRARRFALLS